MIYLKPANLEDAEKEYDFIRQLPEDENGFTNTNFDCSHEDFVERILPGYIDKSKGIGLKPGHVPGTEFSCGMRTRLLDYSESAITCARPLQRVPDT